MLTLLDIRTLILIATILLVGRAVAMGFVWFGARQYAPVRYWALGSAMTAAGALLIGLRDLIPLLASVAFGQALLIFGWLIIDAGIVIAAGRRPPWRTGAGIAIFGVLLTAWFLLVVPDLPLRTLGNSLPGVLFDGYAAAACLRARRGRNKATLLVLAGLLVLLAAASLGKALFILANDVQTLFFSAWQIGQFYVVSFVHILVSAVLFGLLATQSLQERLDQELDERGRVNRQLGEALLRAERFRAALDKVPACVYMKDRQGRYTYANQPTLDLFGCTASELAGSDDSRFFPPETVVRLKQIDAAVLAGQSTREEVVLPDGSNGQRVWLEVKSPVFDGLETRQISGLCGISSDITALKAHERHLEFVAHYDALTRLPNRMLLMDRLTQKLLQCRRRQTRVAVAFLDLDGFKDVNDRHGHDAGDALLIGLARRMLEALREGDTLARLGGDEFIAVIGDLTASGDCEPVLRRLLEAAASPIVVEGTALQISASIGVTVFPDDDGEPQTLLRHADQAMYLAKEAGRNCVRHYRAPAGLAAGAGGKDKKKPGAE